MTTEKMTRDHELEFCSRDENQEAQGPPPAPPLLADRDGAGAAPA